ncbi:hypothetical protein Daus18300_013821 [Diaporthe australafricana]|uniref:Uncharacterized protein n=1 Tax=Diaporthe australafricana TaxID=127596 RepID=A0ABR3VXN6_9PEZI
MASSPAIHVEGLMQQLERTLSRLEDPGLTPAMTKRVAERARAVVDGICDEHQQATLAHQETSRALEQEREAVALERAALKERESSLADRQKRIEEEILVLESKKALNQLRDDVAKLPANIEDLAASLSSSQDEILGEVKSTREEVSSLEETFGNKLDDECKSLFDDLSTRIETISGTVHRNLKPKIRQEGLAIRNHIGSGLDSKIKTIVKEGVSELSSTLGQVQQELGRRPDEEKMDSMIDRISQAQGIIDLLDEIKAAVKEPDTRVSGGSSELKDMLQSMKSGFSRQEELEKTLAETCQEVIAVKAQLQSCQTERDSLEHEVEELKAKGPVTPGPSSRGPGSDQAASSPGFDNEHGSGITDLKKRIIELETELRLTKESQQQKHEDLVCKEYLDDALARMTARLGIRGRNELTSADDGHEAGSVPRGNMFQSRKRARIQQDSSSSSEPGPSSEGREETTFRSTCTAIHEAMGRLHIVQPSRSDLSIAEIVNALTRAFGFTDLEGRVMNHIARSETEKWFCFWEVAESDAPSGVCHCHNPDKASPSKCLAMIVLNRNTMEVRFKSIGTESRV